ncbi:MAG: hypothetical protein GY805_20990 [Chloroflexi bacterium]|nr:hypothetical protein [Chloroflexota bacterium]
MEILEDKVLLIQPDREGSFDYALSEAVDLESSSIEKGELVLKFSKLVSKFEEEYLDRLREAEETIEQLEREIEILKADMDSTALISNEITDELLRMRLTPLENSSLDTMIREASVVLEDRLRLIAGAKGTGLSGVKLVDVVMKPETGILVFSKNPNEQQGAHHLFRGAMQFIRNPPMHNLIEYEADKAQILLKLIDSLLKLLSEPESMGRKSIHLIDIQRMLTRIPIPNGQKALYEALYQAGSRGMTSSELTKDMNRTRPQLAGVLGALGARINGTDGLQGKGGIKVVLDISQPSSGEYRYVMKPMLRQALEIEKVI